MTTDLEVSLISTEYCIDRETNFTVFGEQLKTRASEGTAIPMRRTYNLHMKLPFSPFSHGSYNPSFGQSTGIQNI